jgi:large subunit ribosomal protein L25
MHRQLVQEHLAALVGVSRLDTADEADGRVVDKREEKMMALARQEPFGPSRGRRSVEEVGAGEDDLLVARSEPCDPHRPIVGGDRAGRAAPPAKLDDRMAGNKTVKLEVTVRESTGSRESRRLRREGLVPGVLYGSGAPCAFCVDQRELRKALTGGHGMHAILDVTLDGHGKAHHAVLKDYQLDPRRSTLTHVDLHEVRLDRPIQTQVVIELVGHSEGVAAGGVLQLVTREIALEALPMEVPDRLELDVSALGIGDSVRVEQIAPPAGVTLLADPDTVVATVLAPTVLTVEEEEGVEEEEEGAEVEGEEGAEAADAAESGESESSEGE